MRCPDGERQLAKRPHAPQRGGRDAELLGGVTLQNPLVPGNRALADLELVIIGLCAAAGLAGKGADDVAVCEL